MPLPIGYGEVAELPRRLPRRPLPLRIVRMAIDAAAISSALLILLLAIGAAMGGGHG